MLESAGFHARLCCTSLTQMSEFAATATAASSESLEDTCSSAPSGVHAEVECLTGASFGTPAAMPAAGSPFSAPSAPLSIPPGPPRTTRGEGGHGQRAPVSVERRQVTLQKH